MQVGQNGQNVPAQSDKAEELYALDKSKRILAAINRITESLEQHEPQRGHLRELGCNLLDDTLSFISSQSNKAEEIIKDIYVACNGLVSHIDVLVMSRLLSGTNADLIKDEILSFKNRVDALLERGVDVARIDNLFGDADGPTSLLLQPQVHSYKRLNVTVPPRVSQDTGFVSSGSRAIQGSDLGKVSLGYKDGRRRTVLDFIKKRGAATVRDLTPVIKGCSEKTIQRELAALVSSGELRKEGDRRWSKYFLARPL